MISPINLRLPLVIFKLDLKEKVSILKLDNSNYIVEQKTEIFNVLQGDELLMHDLSDHGRRYLLVCRDNLLD